MFVTGLQLLLLLIQTCQGMIGKPQEGEGQIFTSTYKLKHLMDSEVASVNIIKSYIAHQRQMIENMKEGQKSMEEVVPNPEQYYQGIDHPLNAYRLVNRYVAHWKKVYNTVRLI